MKTFLKYPALLILAAFCLCYGGTKPPPTTWSFRFGEGLVNAASRIEGDVIEAKWMFTSEAYRWHTFRWSYRLHLTDATGAAYVTDWVALPDGVVNDCRAVARVENAAFAEVMCWAVINVGPQVVTNGVYHLAGPMHPMSGDPEKFVTPTVPIRAPKWLNPVNEPKKPNLLISDEIIRLFNAQKKEEK